MPVTESDVQDLEEIEVTILAAIEAALRGLPDRPVSPAVVQGIAGVFWSSFLKILRLVGWTDSMILALIEPDLDRGN